jgi:hypothetical protein
MSAVARMLSTRPGGLASLGMNGILARLLRFVDTNSAFLLGTHLYLDNQGVGVCLPRHMPFRLRRFEEHAASASASTSVEAGRAMEVAGGGEGMGGVGGVEEMRGAPQEMGGLGSGSAGTKRHEVVGLGTVNVERFIGL